MLGLGSGIVTSPTNDGARVQKNAAPAGIDWTVTVLGGITTPMASASGGSNAVNVYFYMDEANDWTGSLGSYTVSNYQVTNNTTGQTSSLSSNLVDVGQVITVHGVRVGLHNIASNSGIAAAHNGSGSNSFTFSFDVDQAGYNTASVSTTVSLTDVTK